MHEYLLRGRRLRKIEELFNTYSHFIGVLLGVAALPLLIVKGSLEGNTLSIVTYVIFGSSIVILYLTSTLYHGVSNKSAKKWLRTLDHCAIYVLIAGSYTPFALLHLESGWNWAIFGIAWGVASFGIIFKMIFRERFEFFSVSLYLAMGWLGVLVFDQITAGLSGLPLWFLISGGLAYTLGVVFYVFDRKPYYHGIWHIFVLAGTTLHFFALYTS